MFTKHFSINVFDVHLKQSSFIQAEYWNVRHMANVCFITYEEMKCDLAAVVKKVSSFLGHPVPEEKMAAFVDHLSFDKMKKNAAVNKQDFVEVTKFYRLILIVKMHPVLVWDTCT